MTLHATRAAALLSWVNSLHVADPVEAVLQLQDCSIFIRIIDSIHGTDEGQQVLQQPVPERLEFVCSFLQKNRKHPSSPECLVSVQKVMEGSELELAKMTMLLLYHSSMSSKSPRDWEQFEYKIQAELAVILKFVLDHEDGLNLNEDLENFLQKAPVPFPCSSTISEELSPPSHQAKREVHFLELQKVASSSGNNFLSGSPASPMGDILQTPQFQMRRLKKQLADERNNRDELELELAENRKLLTEKDAQIAVMQQRIDRLALLNEKQAASPLEPRELEELRGKNESLTVRLHETLKQCQDLKTEKSQMDRKINQLSEENGDLSFKLREFASHLQQLQGALNELTEEHSKATREWVEKQAHLEKELSTALQDKKCLEEKNEILQGKLSQLEEHLAQMRENAPQEKGEVLGDVLQLETLKQEAATLAADNTQLQARAEALETERGQREAKLLAERSRFEEEKQQLAGLIAELQGSLSNLSQAKEELEQASQAQGARLSAQVATLTSELDTLKATVQQRDEELAVLKQQAQTEQAQLAQTLQQQEQASQGLHQQVEQLSSSLKQKEQQLEEAAREQEATRRDHAQQLATVAEEREASLRERDAALRQLEALEKEKAAKLEVLQQQLQAAGEARDSAQSSVTQAQREKAELSQKVEELHGRVEAARQEQCEAQAQVAELKAQLRSEQQKATERERVAQEKAQLQEQVRALEESLKVTKGSLEGEKRRAAGALEEQQRCISRLEAETRSLMEQHKQEQKELEEEKAGRRGLEARLQQLGEAHQAKTEALRQELAEAIVSQREAETECEQLAKEVATWRERYEDSQQEEAQYGAMFQEQLMTLKEECEKARQELQEAKEKVAGIEAHSELQIGRQQSELAQLHANLARALQQVQEKEVRAQKLADDLSALQEKMAATSKEVARLEALVRKAGEQQEASQELVKEPPRAGDRESEWLEEQQGRPFCSTQAALQAMEREAEQMGSELERLRAALMESQGQQQEERGQQEREVARLTQERGRAQADLALEKAAKAELEMRLQNALNEQRVEFATLQEALAQALMEKEGKDQELARLRGREAARGAELKELQQTVERLKEQLARKEEERPQSLGTASREDASGSGAPSEAAGKTEQKGPELEAVRAEVSRLEQQVRQYQEKASSLERSLEAEHARHKERAGALETLRGQLEQQAQELGSGQDALASAQRELATFRAKAQEHSKAEDEWKAQVARGQQEAERKNSLISSLEEEVSILNRQVLEKEGESKELKRLVIAESEKSQKLEERLRLLQAETASSSARAAERSSALREEVQALREEAEKQRVASESLRQELASQAERAEELSQELKAWQEKFFQKEQALSALQLEHTSTQALVSELLPAKHLCQQLQAEQAAAEKRHREELEQSKQAAAGLRAELLRAQRELGELVPLRQKVAEQERAAQQLRAEKASYAEQLSVLKKAHGLLAEENRGLGERANLGRQFLEVELDQAREKYGQELAALRADAETRLAEVQREAQGTARELEVMTAKYEGAKVKVLEERQRFQEERQKLTAQVEQLELFQREQTKQVEELSKKLADHDQASKVQQQKLKAQGGESQQEAQRLQAQLGELQAQLSQKEQAAEHYKLQMEKAKTHYDAKKQQNQELQEQLRGLEQLQTENKELRAEADRLGRELQQAGLKTKEAEQSCRLLTAQVRSLEAQVAHADQQLRDLGKFQVATDALKSREPQAKPQLDLSIDSLDLSCEEGTPLTITSKLPRTQPDGTSIPGEPASPISQRLPHKVESLESLYFTPIPARGQPPLESSLDSLGDVFLDSGRRTRSARRRTTQIINITMTKKLDVEEPDSANSSFYSTQSAPASQAGPRATSSTQSLARLGSPDDGNAALLSLPGYRPTTRSSARRSQAGVSSGAPPGRNSFYVGTCQDEPEQLDDWNRIAELQQRNRVCPPHLKTCYPLESRPSLSLPTITDEEIKTGDPRETLRRASMQPAQIAEGTGITTRQQRKRVSSEPHQGPGTPESKKATTCFPRPMTPRERHEGRRQSTTEAQKKAAPAVVKQADRRQSMAFSILNTPKKLGNSLLRRAASKKAPSKASPNPRSGTRRSPRIATTTASAATAAAIAAATATPRAKGKAKH
ncbi:nuclear mitotic apparatus protein 1 isoform X1 [Hippopotamus amphibius kiboko]|uniref:nuclear mitotic apparatus protein 1 isoform X1 n=1 Tax=Hippopotamus amphibius kiboko TaxID=575201 RepID=UPI002598DA83|nr:nuclear mitotic apparatus protein 1 isoform X1 [Hippopotamus amphibius kiboko]XP_057603487.1 nuclear mitotic apparatus protein 1 isoform X1 [Hippopotamus amphibius kiboko]XP_057603488.1 nuclear mitotic apparatus protein 1 isoform X1 [Hippopotamus amphibius kiboko]XP_057603489.1 nuclear mitotic apparatus protein 1 isoform X1 [Hippopotamus amphibius kiboko]XP_057603490.1 nuclear mitotic apparatus protein 1 isoform X1 [Hippopotamus amphibius kiboko]XP_057603491.1 nuclear mitotic apparatus prot